MDLVPRPKDPRPALAAGVLALLVGGFVVRTLVGPPPAAGRSINEAIGLTGRGEAERAAEVLQSVVVNHPREADAWMRAGKALGRAGRPFEAAVYLRKAAELAPTSSIAQIECVNGLIRAELYDEAEEALDRARSLLPDEAGLLYQAAALSARRGEAGAAARLFRRAVEGDAYKPDRFRTDPLFDPVRNAPAFLQTIYDTRVPDSFRADPS